jgi:hypothetical protein
MKNDAKMNVKKNLYGRAVKVMMSVGAVISGVDAYGLVSHAETSADDVAASVTGPMNSVISVVLSILACVGVFMLAKSIAELVNSIQQQDNSGIFHAARGIASGALMISIKLIINLFGYSF